MTEETRREERECKSNHSWAKTILNAHFMLCACPIPHINHEYTFNGINAEQWHVSRNSYLWCNLFSRQYVVFFSIVFSSGFENKILESDFPSVDLPHKLPFVWPFRELFVVNWPFPLWNWFTGGGNVVVHTCEFNGSGGGDDEATVDSTEPGSL